MRRATWILWLMMALLPLRGWAVGAMGLPGAPAVVAQALASTGASAPAVAAHPPCHETATPAASLGTCQSCDWCHATLALPAALPVVTLHLPVAPPRPIAAQDTGRRLIGGLERPPRVRLA